MIEAGERIIQETRLLDINKGKTQPMRSKEEANDYRYFPEPDLPALVIEKSYVDKIAKELPELPLQKAERFVKEYSIPAYDAGVLTSDQETADYFERAAKLSGEAKQCSTPEKLAGLIKLIKNGTISGKIAKTVFEEMFASGGDAEKIVKDKGLVQISDTSVIEKAVDAVIAANASVVGEIKGGKAGGIGFLVGQVMKATGGKANPQMVNELLKKKISA